MKILETILTFLTALTRIIFPGRKHAKPVRAESGADNEEDRSIINRLDIRPVKGPASG